LLTQRYSWQEEIHQLKGVKQHLRGELVALVEGTVVPIAATVVLRSIYTIGYASTPPRHHSPRRGPYEGWQYFQWPWVLVGGDLEGLRSPVGA